MTPNKIKNAIVKLGQQMSEADANAHDHALHATLSKLHGNHGTSKLLKHFAHMLKEESTGPGYDLGVEPKKAISQIEQLSNMKKAEMSLQQGDQADELRKMMAGKK